MIDIWAGGLGQARLNFVVGKKQADTADLPARTPEVVHLLPQPSPHTPFYPSNSYPPTPPQVMLILPNSLPLPADLLLCCYLFKPIHPTQAVTNFSMSTNSQAVNSSNLDVLIQMHSHLYTMTNPPPAETPGRMLQVPTCPPLLPPRL